MNNEHIWCVDDDCSWGQDVNGGFMGMDTLNTLASVDIATSKKPCEFRYTKEDVYKLPMKRIKKEHLDVGDATEDMNIMIAETDNYDHIQQLLKPKQEDRSTNDLNDLLEAKKDNEEDLLQHFTSQLEVLEGKRNKIEKRIATLVKERDENPVIIKMQMEKKIIEPTRQNFLEEVSREDAVKREMIKKLEDRIREQETIRLKEQQQSSKLLNIQLEKLKNENQKQIQEIELQKWQSEQDKLRSEQLLNEHIDTLVNLWIQRQDFLEEVSREDAVKRKMIKKLEDRIREQETIRLKEQQQSSKLLDIQLEKLKNENQKQIQEIELQKWQSEQDKLRSEQLLNEHIDTLVNLWIQRQDFLEEVSREDAVKRKMIKKLEDRIREQETIRLKEQQQSSKLLNIQLEKLKNENQKQIQEIELQKWQSEQDKLRSEQLLNEHIDTLVNLWIQRQDFLEEVSREDAVKRKMIKKLEDRIREQETIRLKEQQQSSKLLNIQLEKLKNENQKQIQEIELQKWQSEQDKLRSEQLLNEHIDTLVNLWIQRQDFLEEVSREDAVKRKMIKKLEDRIREQETIRLKEQQQSSKLLNIQLEKLKNENQKQIQEIELQKWQSEQDKLRSEQLLNEHIDTLVKEKEEIQRSLSEAKSSADQAVQQLLMVSSESNELINSLQEQLAKETNRCAALEQEKKTLVENLCEWVGDSARRSVNTKLEELGSFVENELTCIVCAELLVAPITLNCSHTFCHHCIITWKKNRNDCPMCRARITAECKSLVLETFIEKMIHNLTDDMKKKREDTLRTRREQEAAAVRDAPRRRHPVLVQLY